MEMHKNTADNFTTQTKRLQQAITDEGAVYLFSNDTTVSVRLFPNMGEPKSHYHDGPMMRKSDIASNIEGFLAHKDSLGFHTVIDFGENIIRQKPSLPVYKAPGLKYLYLTLLGAKETRQGKGPMIINWAVSYQNATAIQDSLTQHYPPFRMISRYLQRYPDFKLYVTATQRKGTDLESFKRTVEQLKQLLIKNGLGIAAFHVNIHRPHKKTEVGS